MPNTTSSRKQRFKAALAYAGLSANQWAKQEGITREHLSRVLNSARESGALIEKIDAFSREQFAAQLAEQQPALAGAK